MTGLRERFESKFSRRNRHWIWNNPSFGKGKYGAISIDGSADDVVPAHRVSYMLFVDPDLKEEDEVHHKCGVKACVAPWHLEKTTHAGNMAHERKATCKNGHDVSILGRTKSGNCKRCMKDYLKEYHAQRNQGRSS